MPHAAREWTLEMVNALPDDGQRYEIIDGELFVTPAPTTLHQRAVVRLVRYLEEYLTGTGIGCTYCSPADITFSPTTLVQPDVLVVPGALGRAPRRWSEVARLLLAIEVRSPSTAAVDQGRKRLLYQRERVPEYWIVDCDARCIERWRPADERPEVLTERISWQPDGARAPLVVELPEFFEGLTTV